MTLELDDEDDDIDADDDDFDDEDNGDEDDEDEGEEPETWQCKEMTPTPKGWLSLDFGARTT